MCLRNIESLHLVNRPKTIGGAGTSTFTTAIVIDVLIKVNVGKCSSRIGSMYGRFTGMNGYQMCGKCAFFLVEGSYIIYLNNKNHSHTSWIAQMANLKSVWTKGEKNQHQKIIDASLVLVKGIVLLSITVNHHWTTIWGIFFSNHLKQIYVPDSAKYLCAWCGDISSVVRHCRSRAAAETSHPSIGVSHQFRCWKKASWGVGNSV